MQLIPVATEYANPVAVGIVAPIKEQSFDEKVAMAVGVIKKQFLDGKRCLVASSFGKDSSVTLALTLTAMQQLKDQGFKLPTLFVLMSDTGVENPVVAQYAKNMIRHLKAYASSNDLPVQMVVCRPSLSNQLLVNLIGGRTIATVPGGGSKCQQMLKASPLDQAKRRIRNIVREEMGEAFTEETLITLIGTRRDESAVRGRNMAGRGESAFEPVNLNADEGGNNWVLSPVADFTTMDIYTYLGAVTNGRMKTFSDFTELTEVYRDSAAGECMIVGYLAGKSEKSTSCGARHGCWSCLKVKDDLSMENMLAEESGKHGWMKPLNAFRNYIKARHFDPASRNWLARTVNTDTGTIKVSPNAYSPAFCLDLLRMALSIDADEQAWARSNKTRPRFALLSEEAVLGISLLWGRYGYHEPFQALREFKDIFEGGKRYPVPTDIKEFDRKDLVIAKAVEVPFVDEHYYGVFEGMRSMVDATGNAERLTLKKDTYMSAVNEADTFELDPEGVALFMEFEMDRALEYYGPHANVCPSEAVHMLNRYGVFTIKKGGHSEWDRMLRAGNQIHRHGIRELLSQPEKLIARLQEIFADQQPVRLAATEDMPAIIQQVTISKGEQLDLFA